MPEIGVSIGIRARGAFIWPTDRGAGTAFATIVHADGSITDYVEATNTDADRHAALSSALTASVSGDNIYLAGRTAQGNNDTAGGLVIYPDLKAGVNLF